jgi:hypothetical protein
VVLHHGREEAVVTDRAERGFAFRVLTPPRRGPTFAPRLLVAFGGSRERFPATSSLQKGSGIPPVMGRSASGRELGGTASLGAAGEAYKEQFEHV